MASFRVELDAPNNIVLVMVTEDDGSEHDYQFDFDPRSGRYGQLPSPAPCGNSI